MKRYLIFAAGLPTTEIAPHLILKLKMPGTGSKELFAKDL
jgi:hypothetical protein